VNVLDQAIPSNWPLPNWPPYFAEGGKFFWPFPCTFFFLKKNWRGVNPPYFPENMLEGGSQLTGYSLMRFHSLVEPKGCKIGPIMVIQTHIDDERNREFCLFSQTKTVIYTKLLFFFVKIIKILRFAHHQCVGEQPLLVPFWSLWFNQGMKKHRKHSNFLSPNFLFGQNVTVF